MLVCFTPCFLWQVKSKMQSIVCIWQRFSFIKKKLLWHFNNKQFSVKPESFLFLIHPSVQVKVLPCCLLPRMLRFPGCSTVWHGFFFLLSDAEVVIPLASWQLVLTPNSLRGLVWREVATAKKIVKPKTICGIRKQRLAPDFLPACGAVRQIFKIPEDWNSNAWWSSFKREALLSIWDERRWQQASMQTTSGKVSTPRACRRENFNRFWVSAKIFFIFRAPRKCMVRVTFKKQNH